MLVVLKIRQMFGCEHPKRTIQSSVIFERGLEIQAALCEECCDICIECGFKAKTRTFNNLKYCDFCFSQKK